MLVHLWILVLEACRPVSEGSFANKDTHAHRPNGLGPTVVHVIAPLLCCCDLNGLISFEKSLIGRCIEDSMLPQMDGSAADAHILVVCVLFGID